ncbi:aspartic proteinase PCS1-like [Andrographis paniculata]|uniref:aspartic proteinase PCS1-like n=1 Tax=Andrographis paniculata TaxID=175694 RepID=UPI0021E77544|nr:aspartic proteinase PCS1-like [Andrographis paniculata]
MASSSPMLLLYTLLLLSLSSLALTLQHNANFSLSFSLFSFSLSQSNLSSMAAAVAAGKFSKKDSPPSDYIYQSRFKYSMALIVSLPIGTPPQAQQMVLDTGSQLSWIQCRRRKSPPAATFDPSRSSSFAVLPCNHPACKPRIPDFTLPTTCDQNKLCHYSYFYADGTLAEGNLVTEKFAFSGGRKVTPPLILGCAGPAAAAAEGILGMNLGRLSFVSQAKIPKFSYCVPPRQGGAAGGKFYLGENPNSRTLKYTSLLTFRGSQRKPNFDPYAYTVGLVAIKVNGAALDIPPAVFRPDAGGSGQTIIDSGTQYSFLVDGAYEKVRAAVARVAGGRMKKGYVYGGSLDMCFDGEAEEIGRLIREMVFVFENGVEIVVGAEGVTAGMGGGVHCVGIGRSGSLGVSSNIIGNFHQRNHWVEFDVANKRVGLGVADCTKEI